MSRREFTVKVRTAAEKRAAGNCEGCGIGLRVGHFHFDHDVPDGLGGEPTLENCRVLCLTCHRIKTHEQDNPRMQKADRAKKKIALSFRKPRSIRAWRRFDGTPVLAPRERS